MQYNRLSLTDKARRGLDARVGVQAHLAAFACIFIRYVNPSHFNTRAVFFILFYWGYTFIDENREEMLLPLTRILFPPLPDPDKKKIDFLRCRVLISI